MLPSKFLKFAACRKLGLRRLFSFSPLKALAAKSLRILSGLWQIAERPAGMPAGVGGLRELPALAAIGRLRGFSAIIL